MNEAYEARPLTVPAVTVLSCSPEGWLTSSHRMGEDLMHALGAERYEVVTARTPEEFASVFSRVDGALLLHVHGSAVGLYDDGGGVGTVRIVSIEEALALPVNPRIRVVVCTACETASGEPEGNIMSALSRRIAPGGILLANRYTVWGASTAFYAADGRHGWVVYSDGQLLLAPEALPVELRMEDVPGIAASCRR